MESLQGSFLNSATQSAATETDLRLGLWSLDSATQQLYVDTGFRRLLGHPEPVCASLSQLIDLMHPNDVCEFERRIMAALKGRTGEFAMDFRLRHPERDWLWLLARATTSDSNESVVLRGYVVDIDDRKAADAALHSALEQSESMLHSAPTAIVVLHGNVITSGNHAFEQLFAAPLHTLVGRDIRKFVVDTDGWTNAVAGMADVRSVDIPVVENIEFRRPDRSVFTARLSGRRLGTEDDAVLCLVDISRQVAMSRALEQARDAAQAASIAKSRFLAITSREIRTPMNGVLDMLDMLGATALDESQQKTLQVARDSAVSLLTILNEIHDYSNIDAGAMDMKPEPVDIGELAGQSVELYREIARRKGLSLVLTADAGLPAIVLIDRLRLCQVINNLLSNAVKFTARGTISLAIERRESAPGRPQLHVEIRDTGEGIAAADLETLCQPFEQLDSGSTQRRNGRGLELSISRTLVECMGGTMNIRSILGEGTLVTFALPLNLSEDMHGGSAMQRSATVAAAVRTHVPAGLLPGEGRPANQMLLRQQAEIPGHTVEVANDESRGRAGASMKDGIPVPADDRRSMTDRRTRPALGPWQRAARLVGSGSASSSHPASNV